MIPSTDIVQDLKKNLKIWGVTDVTIVEEFSESPRAVKRVAEILNGEKISLIILDSNGSITSELERYKTFLEPKCKVIIDDFLIEGSESNGKNLQVNAEVNQLLNNGALVKEFINGWGTFFGTLNKENLGSV